MNEEEWTAWINELEEKIKKMNEYLAILHEIWSEWNDRHVQPWISFETWLRFYKWYFNEG